jgi:integrase
MLLADSPFSIGCQLWFETHSQYIKPSTARIYREHVKTLSAFYADLPLNQFHIGSVRAYQQWRQAKASNQVINMEIRAVLIPLLKEVEIWPRIEGVYRTLPVVKKKVRQSMGDEEERRFLAVALDATHPRRLLAGHCLVVMCNTSMGFGELSHLRRADVVLNEEIPFVTVNEGTKNDFRIRTIPLNWLALRSMRWILHRFEDLGGTEPGQYILPHRATHPVGDKQYGKRPPDFRKPMGKINHAAQEIFTEAGLSHFVPYDMRSCAVTKILSDPNVSDQMAQEIIGHSDTLTKRRYSRQRLEKKAVAMDKMALEPKPHMGGLLVFKGGQK